MIIGKVREKRGVVEDRRIYLGIVKNTVSFWTVIIYFADGGRNRIDEWMNEKLELKWKEKIC